MTTPLPRRPRTARRARLLAPLVAAGLVLSLSACGDDAGERLADGVGERALEEALEQQGEDGAEVDVDLDGDGGVSIETDEGTVTSGTELPADFPEDLPLVEGRLFSSVSSTATGSEGFVVSVQTALDRDEALAQAAALLVDAGFTADADMAAAGLQQLTRAPYTVLLSPLPGETGALLQYIVQVD